MNLLEMIRENAFVIAFGLGLIWLVLGLTRGYGSLGFFAWALNTVAGLIHWVPALIIGLIFAWMFLMQPPVTVALAVNLEVIGELFAYLWQRRLWWLIPMVILLVVFGLLMFFSSASGLGPFIYTLF